MEVLSSSLHVVGPLMMSCIRDTVTNNKADVKSPPPVILTASRHQSFSCHLAVQSTSSRHQSYFSPVSHISASVESAGLCNVSRITVEPQVGINGYAQATWTAMRLAECLQQRLRWWCWQLTGAEQECRERPPLTCQCWAAGHSAETRRELRLRYG